MSNFKALLFTQADKLSRIISPCCRYAAPRFLRRTKIILLILALSVCHQSVAATQFDNEIASIDRGLFGKSPLSLWSPLNSFELNTIAGFPIDHERDPEKLLALYLIASGELRTQKEFNAINARLDQWITSTLRDFSNTHSPFETGKKLLEAMHDSFFIPSSETKPLGSYELDQSQLMEIFTSKNYNCISSSLLYIVLAHKLGLNTQAVLVPSHVFVQLNLDGDLVEVETTSANGFNVRHDEEYYERNSAQWLSDRQLPGASYEDYLNRKIVSAAEIGAENLWSQHTKAERMHYFDRMRLAEIKSYLEPGNYLAQKNRLSYYNIEFNYLQSQQDLDALAHLFNHVEAYIDSLPETTSSSAAKSDNDFQNLLAWTYSNQAYSFVHSIDPDKGLELARNQLTQLHANISDRASIESNLYLSLGIYAEKKAQENEYAKGKAAFDGIEQQCANHHSCVNGLSKFYSAWAKHYWDNKNWQKSIEIYARFLSLNSTAESVHGFRSNVESAYLNRSNELLLDEDWDAAIEGLENCMSQLPNPERCENRLAEIKQAIRLMEE